MNAELPNFLWNSDPISPVNLFNETFKNLSPMSGGKSEGNVPFMLLSDTSKCVNRRRLEMGFKLPEILQLEMSRCSSLVRFSNPEGKTLRSLFERSRTVSA